MVTASSLWTPGSGRCDVGGDRVQWLWDEQRFLTEDRTCSSYIAISSGCASVLREAGGSRNGEAPGIHTPPRPGSHLREELLPQQANRRRVHMRCRLKRYRDSTT